MTQKEKIATESFHKPYSCAQAVYIAFAESPTQEMLDFFKQNSGGRTEGNICGALFAARFLADKSKHAQIDAYFKEHAGALECKQIKTQAKTPCVNCVAYAVQALEKTNA